MAKAGSPWTGQEETFVRNNYKKLTTKELAKQLNRPYGGVAWKIHQLELANELNTPTKINVKAKGSYSHRVPVRVTPKKPWWKFWG